MFRDTSFAEPSFDFPLPPVFATSNQVKLTPDSVRVCFASDLHLDTYAAPIDDAFFEVVGDILILAGDVLESRKAGAYPDFWKKCSENWAHTLVVPGNHEYYHSRLDESLNQLKGATSKYGNIHILQNEVFEYRGVYFLGGTLWTDMDNGDNLACLNAEKLMNDFRLIKTKDFKKLRAQDTVVLHNKTLDFLKNKLLALWDKKCIVISHHAPSSISVNSRYRDPKYRLDNFCYYSNLEPLILSFPNILHWIHGHMHTFCHYQIAQCHVHCNPRGYPKEQAMRTNVPYQPLAFTVEID